MFLSVLVKELSGIVLGSLSSLPSLIAVTSHGIVSDCQEEIFDDNRQRSSHVP